MTPYGSGTNSTLITLAIVLLVVVRFLFRELRRRTIRVRTLWIRPGILAVFSVLLIAGAFAVPGVNLAVMGVALAVGAAVGLVVGMLVVRSTTFAPTGRPGSAYAQGNAVTVTVWVVALALRFVARIAFVGSGAGPAQQYELNAGLLALVTAAFIVVALEFHRAIDRLAPASDAANVAGTR